MSYITLNSLEILRGGGQGGVLLLKGFPDLGSVFLILVWMDEGGGNDHGKGAKALVIGIEPGIDLRLVDDLIILLLLNRFEDGDGVSSTNGAEVVSDEGCPLLIVGTGKSRDMEDEVGRGHFIEGWF